MQLNDSIESCVGCILIRVLFSATFLEEIQIDSSSKSYDSVNVETKNQESPTLLVRLCFRHHDLLHVENDTTLVESYFRLIPARAYFTEYSNSDRISAERNITLFLTVR